MCDADCMCGCMAAAGRGAAMRATLAAAALLLHALPPASTSLVRPVFQQVPHCAVFDELSSATIVVSGGAPPQ
eukprot:COSAG05_NODE_17430_length_325_cov_0.898230_1_plen_72_part_10